MISARGTSRSALVASRAGNFALRARCKSRGELRVPRSLQVAHCSKSQRFHLEFARMFAEDVLYMVFR